MNRLVFKFVALLVCVALTSGGLASSASAQEKKKIKILKSDAKAKDDNA